MYGLSLEWERCPDGVEVVEVVARQATDPRRQPENPLMQYIPSKEGSVFFRYRTEKRAGISLSLAGLENPLVVRYVNAITDDARAQFFSRFGLTFGQLGQIHKGNMMNRWEVEEEQDSLRALLYRVGHRPPAEIKAVVNAELERCEVKLRPSLDFAASSAVPRLALAPESPHGFMLLEIAMAVAYDTRFHTCEHCGNGFLTGSMTGRRAHARFCADRCRVAAMRKRNAEGAAK